MIREGYCCSEVVFTREPWEVILAFDYHANTYLIGILTTDSSFQMQSGYRVVKKPIPMYVGPLVSWQQGLRGNGCFLNCPVSLCNHGTRINSNTYRDREDAWKESKWSMIDSSIL